MDHPQRAPLPEMPKFDDEGKPMTKSKWKKICKKRRKEEAKKAKKANASAAGGQVHGTTFEQPQPGEDYAITRARDIKYMVEHGKTTHLNSVYSYKFVPQYEGMDEGSVYQKMNHEEYVERYSSLGAESEVESDLYYVIGRITRINEVGSKLFFVDIVFGLNKIQIKLDRRLYKEGNSTENTHKNFKLYKYVMRIGDVYGFAGHVGRTKAGELSLYCHYCQLQTPCMEPLPPFTKTITHNVVNEETGETTQETTEISGLQNKEIRFRARELDLIINPNTMRTFIMRSKVETALRRYLEDEMGLISVTTPTLALTVGGATARPFTTTSYDYGCEMFLRIAPELYLKRLIVGGFDPGVFEIGKNFRNEGNDLTHNSEFTSLEFYKKNEDYEGLMEIAENMLYTVVAQVTGGTSVEYDGKTIDFSPPFQRLDMIDTLEREAGIKIPEDLSTEEARVHLDQYCTRLEVDCSAPRTTARLLDKLVERFVEPLCVNPTFITGHPIIMSPLAKPDRNGTQRTERFELFVNCTELANAYTELNDPEIQMKNFMSQAKDKAKGDDEAMCLDPEFVRSLMIGLPPTGGFGLGIDRLVMFLTNNTSIREVILFPTMKPVRTEEDDFEF